MELNIENLMKTAIAEMENGQYAEAEQHFDMVVVNAPEIIDAPFFRAFCGSRKEIIKDATNTATKFTNAFIKYVDDVKELNDPAAEKEKLDYAAGLLTRLVSFYLYNGMADFLNASNIFSAGYRMSVECVEKIKDAKVTVSQDIMDKILIIEKDLCRRRNVSDGYKLIGIIVAALAGIAFIIFAFQ